MLAKTKQSIATLRDYAVGLPNYDAMLLAIERASSFDEASELGNQAEAMRVYSRQMRNIEAELQCAALRFLAEWRFGQMLFEARQAGLLQAPSEGGYSDKPSYRKLGLEHKHAQAVVWLGRKSRSEIDQIISDHRTENYGRRRATPLHADHVHRIETRVRRIRAVNPSVSSFDRVSLFGHFPAGVRFGAALRIADEVQAFARFYRALVDHIGSADHDRQIRDLVSDRKFQQLFEQSNGNRS